MANYDEKQRADAEAREKAVREARDLVGRWSVGAALKELMEQAYPPQDRPVSVMAWPGCVADWPEPEDRRCLVKDAALPHDRGVDRADWRPLWKAVGPPRPDWLAVLVGPTGSGKTAWGVQVAEGAAAGGSPVLYLSVELGQAELAARFLALRSRGPVPWGDVLSGRINEPELVNAGAALEDDCPALYLWAPNPKERTATALSAMARAISSVHDGRPPLILIDYLQRMTGDGKDRRLEVAELSGELRALSRPGGGWPGAAVIVLSSTARGKGYDLVKSQEALLDAFHKNPDDLVGMGKESGEIEYDASLLMVLTCDPREEGQTERSGALVAPKVRQGRATAIEVAFDGARGWWGKMKTATTNTKTTSRSGAQSPRDKGRQDGGGPWVS